MNEPWRLAGSTFTCTQTSSASSGGGYSLIQQQEGDPQANCSLCFPHAEARKGTLKPYLATHMQTVSLYTSVLTSEAVNNQTY